MGPFAVMYAEIFREYILFSVGDLFVNFEEQFSVKNMYGWLG